MKTLSQIFLRLVASVALSFALSACTSNDSGAYYHNPAIANSSIYGYNAVDFEALDIHRR